MSTFSSDFWTPGLENTVRRKILDPSRQNSTTSFSPSINDVPTPLTATSRSSSHTSRLDPTYASEFVTEPASTSPHPQPKKLSVFHRIFKKSDKTDSPGADFSDDTDPFEELNCAPGDKKGRRLSIVKKSQELDVTLCNGVTVQSLRKKYGVVCESDDNNIGKGATAVVRLAYSLEDADRKQMYAIKEFRKRRKDESEREYIKKLTAEFCISSAMHHPNIVETVDLVYDTDHQWCAIMEFCAGGDMYGVIKHGKLRTEDIACCFKQLVQAVDYLHSQGVAHRDIKPENLLVNEHGQLKLTDFGVSDVFQVCWERDAHASRGLCGSEPYMAPELFLRKDYDARCVDVWSCGVVFYAMTYQGVMFHRASREDLNYITYIEKRNLGLYEPFNRIQDESCRTIITKILDPNPELRATIKDITENAWFMGIDVCKDCVGADGSEHLHFSEEYTRLKKHREALLVAEKRKLTS
jgi:tRNA A-37 threonylcarbamoyl transferase component Bud32